MEDLKELWFIIKCGIIILLTLILGFGILNPASRIYGVWSERKQGEAELAGAESNRQIKTLEAKAGEESACNLPILESQRLK